MLLLVRHLLLVAMPFVPFVAFASLTTLKQRLPVPREANEASEAEANGDSIVITAAPMAPIDAGDPRLVRVR